MLTKAQIQMIQSLKQKKFREVHRLFIVEGEKLVVELLDSKLSIKHLIALKSHSNHFQQLCPKDLIVETTDDITFNKFSSMSTPPPVLAVVEMPEDSTEIPQTPFHLFLAGIRDPGNLGTIVRIADWYGIKHIVCSEDTVDIYNPKTVQSAMGSLFRVQVDYQNSKHYLRNFDGNIYGADMNGENIHHFTFNANPHLLVIGNESNGIPENIKPMITKYISIPGAGSTESLNAAVATGIIIDNYFRNL